MSEEMLKTVHTTTTFQISRHLHTQLKMMCMLTHKSMGEFIRMAVLDKINQLKAQKPL
jgi:predicted component of type VI protein secretion system